MDLNKNLIENKTVLITGGTGSFGHAIAKKLFSLNPKEVIIFSRDEKKQFDMANEFVDDRLRFIIGDVRNQERLYYLMRTMKIDIVFHAAALKQVPNCEFFPMETILTNTIGTYNVIVTAIHHDVERVVVLSTDKAVYPVNVMGMTKALAERIMVALSREKRSGRTILCGIRYGNVMYTRGSVIPFFIDQMKAGYHLTITNKDMTRFMMSLDDSINLVLYAMVNGKDGEIYVRKAPAAAIGDLGQALIALFDYDKEIKEIGIRPGEKMHESLISREEAVRTEDCGDYYKIRPEVPEMNMKKYYYTGDGKSVVLPEEGYTSANTRRLNIEEIKQLLLTLPEIQEELKNFRK